MWFGVVFAGFCIASAYALLVFYSLYSWRRLPLASIPRDFEPGTFISVIVPARNEAAKIDACIASLRAQSYPPPLYEIIVVDDHSNDDTGAIAEVAGATVLSLGAGSGGQKKAAVAFGVAHAKGEWIAATDADCIVPPDWLRMIAWEAEKKKAVMLAGAVAFSNEKNLLERFQSLDLLGMMVLTGAGIYSKTLLFCNGANLAYAKSAFMAVDGFAGNEGRASGDDMFLMQKLVRHFPGKVAFLKYPVEAVNTSAEPTVGALIAQRLRWASKMDAFRSPWMLVYSAVPFALSWAVLIAFAAIPWLGVNAAWLMLGLFAAKAIPDYFLLREATHFYARKDLMRVFLPAQLLHLLYMAGIGLASFFVKQYSWKGRKLR